MNINEVYRKEELKEEMKEHFEGNGFLQLNSFFTDNLSPFKKEIISKTNSINYNPLSHSRYELDENTKFDSSILLFLEYFKSKEFTSYLEEITGFSLTPHECTLKRYTHKNYTLLNDKKIPEEDFLEVLFDLSDEFPENSGGTLVYTTQTEEVLYLEPSYNTLTFLYKPKELMSYLKYINSKAKDKNIIRVEMKFTLID